MSIPFTQFLLPHGQKRRVTIDRPPQIEEMASQLILMGCKFEIEVLQTSEISMETMDSQGNAILGEVCQNGPAVGEAVDRMITAAYEKHVAKLVAK